ncbi:UNVERIFIED_CONTAM: hypothetical protein FKN15_029511 [Acipenser sinensis]
MPPIYTLAHDPEVNERIRSSSPRMPRRLPSSITATPVPLPTTLPHVVSVKGIMDRNALAELLQALESRRDAEERRREERYTALIERRKPVLTCVRVYTSRGSLSCPVLSCPYLCYMITPAEGACPVLTCVTGSLLQREPSLSCVTGSLQQRELVLFLPVLQDPFSRGSLSCSYLCYRIPSAEGACPVLTCVTGSLQQREPVLFLPVLQDPFSRGSLSCSYLCCRITPAEGACHFLCYRNTPAEGIGPVLTCAAGSPSRESRAISYLCGGLFPAVQTCPLLTWGLTHSRRGNLYILTITPDTVTCSCGLGPCSRNLHRHRPVLSQYS